MGATVLLSRVNANAVVRIGIDASYVVNGMSKRARPEKGKHGDIWCLFLALLDYRIAEIGIAKVRSHIEAFGPEAVLNQWASVCEIIGNALGDEAAEQAAKTFQPPKQTWLDREALDKETFVICIRLALTQARVWELTNDSFLYECPPELVEQETDFGNHLPGLREEFAANGHLLEAAFRRRVEGHTCLRCHRWENKAKFNDWLNTSVCRATPPAKLRRQKFEEESTRKMKAI